MHVLLIEDNEGRPELSGLRSAGRNLTTSPSIGQTDWTRASQAHGRPVDAVLVDLSLPDSHGLETLERVRPQAGEAAVIVLTGLDNGGR